MNPETIKAKATELAQRDGLLNLDVATLCDEVGIARGSFNYIYGATFNALVEQLHNEGQPLGTAVAKRANKNLRIAQIVESVAAYVSETGSLQFSRQEAADAAGISVPLVARYFGDVQSLRDAVVGHGLAKRDARVVGAAIAARHAAVETCDAELKAAALATL